MLLCLTIPSLAEPEDSEQPPAESETETEATAAPEATPEAPPEEMPDPDPGNDPEDPEEDPEESPEANETGEDDEEEPEEEEEEPEPEISVIIPADAQLNFNPYMLDVDSGGGTVNHQIIFEPLEIKSESNVDVTIGVTVGELEVPEGVTFVPSSQRDKVSASTEHEIFAYISLEGAASPSVPAGFAELMDNQAVITPGGDGAIALGRIPASENGESIFLKIGGVMAEHPSSVWAFPDPEFAMTIKYSFEIDE